MNLKTILTSDNVSKEILKNIDYILTLIPEIKPMIGFNQKHPHHNLDVFMHTLKALENSKNDYTIRLALLFHDIGKPFSYTEGEVRHFPNHPIVSEEITRKVLTRLNYEKTVIDEVCYLVKYHDTPIKEEEVLKNYCLELKRYEVQRCDTLAHNPSKNTKREAYLVKTKKYFK